MKKLLIFGNGKIAEVLHYYFEHDSDYEVAGFVADREYIEATEFCGLPVLEFETIEQSHITDEYCFFVAIGYQNMNRLRAEKLKAVKEKGYEVISYIHPDSGVPFDLEYGENCFIMNQVQVHPRVKMGDNVFVWSGSMIGHHTVIGNDNWFTSAVNISGNVTIGNNCFFAINATIGHGIEIGNAAFLGANSLVTKSIPDETVIVAQPNKPFRLTSSQFIRFSKFENL